MTQVRRFLEQTDKAVCGYTENLLKTDFLNLKEEQRNVNNAV